MTDANHLAVPLLGEPLATLGIVPFTSLVWLLVYLWDPFWSLHSMHLDLWPLYLAGGVSIAPGCVLLRRGLVRATAIEDANIGAGK